MRRKKIDLSIERKILINGIISDRFLREITPLIKIKYFKSVYSKLVINWILEYWKEFQSAPGKNIKEIFMQKSKLIQNEEDVEDISEFLSSISDEWEKEDNKLNFDFEIKQAVQYLKLRSLEILKEQIDFSITSGDIVKGEQAVSEYKRVEKASGAGISILSDTEEIENAFMDENEVLFRFPGVFGEVCGSFLRGDLVSFMGAPKKGKSWYLLYSAETAAYYGYKTVFFNLEMTKNQMLRRSWQSLIGKPRNSRKIVLPSFQQKGNKWEVVLTEKEKDAIDISKIEEQQKKLKRLFRTGEFRTVLLPSYITTVENIEAHLDNFYYYDNFTPDVVVIDYADLLSSSIRFNQHRHNLDNIWNNLRRIARDRNILVITASQAGRAAFNKDVSEEDTAEDIRKLAHVGKMITINKSKEDYKLKAVRIAQLVERDEVHNIKQALVLQCLEIGRAYIDSRYNTEVIR